jgi:predicted ATPase
MQSWAQLQLEPSKLRAPDSFSSEDRMSPNGEHLPATLLRLGDFDRVSNLLARLLPDVDGLRVDVDEARRSKTLYLTQRDGAEHPARSLSDGTLRFLALAVLSCDPLAGGVICMEEPENGIHPARIPAIVELLKGMVVDISEPVGEDNPMRQIIINTHSPAVIKNLEISDLVIATPVRLGRASITTFGAIKGTWRDGLTAEGLPAPHVTRASLIDYLEDRGGDRIQQSLTAGQASVADWA